MPSPPPLTFVCPDLSTNCLGRTLLLAELVTANNDVRIVGAQLGAKVWPPATTSKVPIHAFQLGSSIDWPRAVRWMRGFVQGSRVVVTKPLATSLGLARLAGARGDNTVLDIDDWELGLKRSHGHRGVLRQGVELADPKAFNSLATTALLELGLRAYPHRLVSNRWLQHRFGGTLLPHVRDTDWLLPNESDRAEVRRELQMGDRCWVGFIGTPRSHKGVDDLVHAVARADGELGLMLAGLDHRDDYARELSSLALDVLGQARVRAIGPFAFDELPRWLAAPDIIALPSRDEPGAIGQIPAKLFDAMAMGKAIVASDVNDMASILGDAGVTVPAGDLDALSLALAALAADPIERSRLSVAVRKRAQDRFSYAAGTRTLQATLDKLDAGRGA